MASHPIMPDPARTARAGFKLCRRMGMNNAQAADTVWAAAMIARTQARIAGIERTPWLDAIVAHSELAAPGQRAFSSTLPKGTETP